MSSNGTQALTPAADAIADPSRVLSEFHPVIREWFYTRFAQPTEAQLDGWPAILAGGDVLLAAPTGSGKTLAAFLCAIDRLVREGCAGALTNATRVVYVSPLKALSNDIQKNLTEPLREIQELARDAGYEFPEIRVEVRTGDTSASRRAAIVRRPPHILVTTPESLYLMLTAEKSRDVLRTTSTVIVDEIHAVARDKRGAHLALSLERLDHLVTHERTNDSREYNASPPQRIGLSATQRPIERIAAFLTGGKSCTILDTGHVRELDLAVEVPASELSAVCSHEQWAEIHERLCELIQSHRSTIIFVNTRAMAERVTHHLCLRLGENAVASHHGSLSKETRLRAEERLKSGELTAIVATASLELGIDIGHVDLVCQIGSPRSIAAFLQRVGRSGHHVGALPKGRLFALTRDELIEALALIRAIRRGQLDPVTIPEQPLDILAQQIVAAVGCEEWSTGDLYETCKRAYPYRELTYADFEEIVAMLARGYGNQHRKIAYIYHDAINGKLRARRGARIAAITSGGAIPEQPLYRVVNIDDGTFVGTLDEDFATERGAGTIFLLGNTSWQIIHTRGLIVSVRDARGAAPSMPFWFGEAPGRTLELSTAVSDLRAELARTLREDHADFSDTPDLTQALRLLTDEVGANDHANRQAALYVAVQQAALRVVPTQSEIVFERFFDDTGGMQLVIHAPFGTRINRAWGLALRKRFCRSFDFELQASADDDGVVLSLGPNQSFPIEQLFGFLTPDNVQPLLEQAFLQVPFFRTRWQWNANRSLAVLRNRMGKRVAPALQRMRGDDLLTSIFPASTQCFEHITGDIELPDHPLVRETMKDCLTDAADLAGLSRVLEDIRMKRIALTARDTREPSPFAYERLNASPYAFLDDAGLLERRTRALSQRRTLPLEELRDLTWLDQAAIQQVAREAYPTARDADELHDVLFHAGVFPVAEGIAAGWLNLYEQLYANGRAGTLTIVATAQQFWFAVEQTALIRAAYANAAAADFDLPVTNAAHAKYPAPPRLDEQTPPDSVTAKAYLLTGQLTLRPIQTATQLAELLAFSPAGLTTHLEALEAQGGILRGRWTPRETNAPDAQTSDEPPEYQWCDRRLLQRIHRLTLAGLRDRIRPVSPREYLAYLIDRHRVRSDRNLTGKDGLFAALLRLQGFATAAGAWEAEILPARVAGYDPRWLDELCLSGVLTYGRMHNAAPETNANATHGMSRVVPFAFALREDLEWIYPPRDFDDARTSTTENENDNDAKLSRYARIILSALESHGAQFVTELRGRTGLSPRELDRSLGELARKGRITADGFATLRAYLNPATRENGFRRRDRMRRNLTPRGRIALFPGPLPIANTEAEKTERLEHWARLLLDRYGMLCRDILTRESLAPAWRELSPILRRLEARGEIRGGRFVTGVSGEQFALPDVCEELRNLRDEFKDSETNTSDFVVLSAADPLNLVGILTDGERVPANRNTRLVFLAGRHVATYAGGEVIFHETIDRATGDRIFSALQSPSHIMLLKQ